MSKALVRREGGDNTGRGAVAAVCSALLPGSGQLINGQTDKALGVFVVYAVAGAGVVGAIPLIGPVAGAVAGVTWLYGVIDGYIEGKKKK